ncbi:SatD family protein [Homoserinibacter gongjuensis]|uniref:Transcriptional regulator n=1 Tax=Homoserinibacter gongjuensis TaxID=1162968 RepID=A0ABQ6JYY2_9MICO|nr:SatD family protein [Homoserinibacter gongjuensis]GMA92857.1 transcriptional regulator [Homoserinibacter gongjuensis]
MDQVVAIIADIVGSRELDDRNAAQLELERAFARQHEVAPLLEPFLPTVGDEFQAVAADIPAALRATLAARLAFPDGVDCRFGLGLGDSREVSSSRPDDIRDGSAWWRAREAIETAHRRMDAGRTTVRTWYVADAAGPASDDTVATVNAYLVMRDHVVSRMKRLDRELTFGQLAGETQVELARRHGISQSAISQRLERSGGSALLATVDLTGGSPR